jgi:hypothetical protein
MYLHPTYAITPQREPLGVLDAWMWARQPKGPDGTRAGEKESVRWLEGYARVAELAAELPATRLVYVADREADIRDLMVRARDLGTPADWLVRVLFPILIRKPPAIFAGSLPPVMSFSGEGKG